MYRQEVGNPFVDNFCVTLRPCEHIQKYYKVNDEIIIITNVALVFINF